MVLLLLVLLAGKAALIFGLSRVFRTDTSVSLCTGLALAGAGEFGLVLVSEAAQLQLMPAGMTQVGRAALVLPSGSAAVGRTLKALDLARMHVDVTALRRRNIRNSTPDPDTVLAEGDVAVLRGKHEDLAEAEIYLMQGGSGRWA